MPNICAIIIAKLLFTTKYILTCLLLITLTSQVSLALPTGLSSFKATPNKLLISDCQKCHSNVIADIETNGMAHKTEVSCIDCHVGHPPAAHDIIPPCSRCHEGEKHFELDNCLLCHRNPHTPLNIYLTRNITDPCTTCHDEQITQLQQYPSVHTTLDCTACHTEHGYLPPCFNCHGPHLETMTNKICHDCHLPHMPLEVTYPADTPSEYCGACHKKVYSLLARSRARHRSILCVECHENKHKTIPACTKCHKPPPHSPLMIQEKSCEECHGIAHDVRFNRIDISYPQKDKEK